MPEFGFSLTRLFVYKDRIVDSAHIQEHTGHSKPGIFCAVNFFQDSGSCLALDFNLG